MKGIRTPFAIGMEHENWRNGGIPLFSTSSTASASMSTNKYYTSTTSQQNCPEDPEMLPSCCYLQESGKTEHPSHIYKKHDFPSPPDSFD